MTQMSENTKLNTKLAFNRASLCTHTFEMSQINGQGGVTFVKTCFYKLMPYI